MDGIFLNGDFFIHLLVWLCGIGVGILYYKLFRKENLEELTDKGIEAVANYRDSTIGLWICLLTSWLGAKEDQIKTEFFLADIDINVVNFSYQNFNVSARFNWKTNCITVVVNGFNQTTQKYKSYLKTINLNKESLESKKVHEFITKTFDEYLNLNKISFEDIVAITTELKNYKKDFTDEKEKKNFLFEKILDLMLLMKDEKNRQNKSLVKAYGGLVHYLWSAYAEDFSTFLKDK